MDKPFTSLYFNAYCKECKFRDKDKDDSPCDDCLNEPVCSYSSKPVYFVKEKRGGGGKKDV